ncbi:MAG TPA: hydroxyisourate hydrolase [Streptosporangiaceae bacterium]|jgi:5-hydroxyisourate hydrolase
MSLSTHVLDATLGRPAADVAVRLDRRGSGGEWAEVATGRTGPDGRLADWLPDSEPATGVYRLTFGTGDYFAARGVATLYPEVTVTFQVRDADGHFHLPLLLSPYAYSTYRGS